MTVDAAAVDVWNEQITGLMPQDLDPERCWSLHVSLAQLAHTARQLSGQLEVRRWRQVFPKGLARIDWTLAYEYDDEGGYYPCATAITLQFQPAENRPAWSLGVRCDDYDLDDVPAEVLTSLTGLPVDSDEQRDAAEQALLGTGWPDGYDVADVLVEMHRGPGDYQLDMATGELRP